MTVEEKAYNYASKVVKNRLTASEVAAHYGRGYIEGQEDMKQLGWHPASEPPKEDGEYIVTKVWGYTKDALFYARFENGKWSIPQVKWWCYPPKEE